MSKNAFIHWFRQDLRISDNPSLYEAAKQGVILPIYILDDKNSAEFALGSASRWWLHHSLEKLNDSLNGKLCVFSGDPKKILIKLCAQYNITAIYWNRCYEPWQVLRDKEIKKELKELNIKIRTFNGSLLWEPWDVLKNDGMPYKVFTPFYRKGCTNAPLPRKPLSKPRGLKLHKNINSGSITDLKLLPTIRWDLKLETNWNIGEFSAQKKLKKFLSEGLSDYKEGRNYPAKQNVSRLSPHLHFGEISPNQIWYKAHSCEKSNDLDHFLSELGWREFSYNLLYHFPKLPRKNLQAKFNKFPWSENQEYLNRWQHGQTGYPLVDAGLRELWQTGYMHNRVRMIVGSFLVKNLLIHWHHGEKWFWDCLVDADLANNSASWQWIAGCGADAAPYFRIFNPVTQGHKFDPEGEYTRQFISELRNLPNKYLYSPWEAPDNILEEAGIVLGENYPKPIVNLKDSRKRALDSYQLI